MIIGVTGRARHGKNSVGEILVKRYGFKQVAFADKVREFALAIDPMIQTYPLSHYIHVLGWEESKKIAEVRQLLQRIGTEGGRNVIGPDVWVDALWNSFEDGVDYVITDVRFPNEAKAIIDNDGLILKVVRPDFDNGVGDDHPSEKYIDSLPFFQQVDNDGDLDKLTFDVSKFMDREIYHVR